MKIPTVILELLATASGVHSKKTMLRTRELDPEDGRFDCEPGDYCIDGFHKEVLCFYHHNEPDDI